jgi:hypothetical protein
MSPSLGSLERHFLKQILNGVKFELWQVETQKEIAAWRKQGIELLSQGLYSLPCGQSVVEAGKRWDLFTRHHCDLSCRHQRPHDNTRCINGTSCSFDFMACSVCLEVMPHSATSSVSGDDMSTTVTWNSGVRAIHCVMCVNTLWHDASQKPVTPGHLVAPSCS